MHSGSRHCFIENDHRLVQLLFTSLRRVLEGAVLLTAICLWPAAELIDTETADFGSDPEKIILSEFEGDQGKAKIVYRPGGEVDVGQLATLCSKVGWPQRPSEKVAGALKNSFLVCFTALDAVQQDLQRAASKSGHAATDETSNIVSLLPGENQLGCWVDTQHCTAGGWE